MPVVGHFLTGVPRPPETADRLPCRRRQALRVQLKKGFELIQVNVFLLLIDMPQQRAPCPLGADKGIFAAHGIEIATPEQPVILVLPDEGQHLHGQGVTHMQVTRHQLIDSEPARDVAEYSSLGHQQMCVRRIGGH
ncbi:hypothetical protein D3C80_1733350 [compost metagenome]